ncbi:MAG TPA: carboxypeptidase-like regulatory domain-containing protein, partial [bacterium]|nr:carboxypeptidase-like regulatory domain-containing protein [bacterium]
TTDLLLDFDVSESFKPIPASARKAEDIQRFQFHPVLRVANVSTAGTVSGRVWDDHGTVGDSSDDQVIVGATVTVLESDGTVVLANTATNEEGRFSMSGVKAGNLILRVEADGFEKVERPISVVPANNTRVTIRMSTVGREVSRTEQIAS